MSTITTGNNLEVYESGSLVFTNDDTINFSLSLQLTIRFVFINDSRNTNARFEGQVINDNLLEVRLINFNNSLPTGNPEASEIGYLNNRRLFINYAVLAINESHRIFHYTFYLGERIDG